MLTVSRWRVILVAVVTVLGTLFTMPNLLPEQFRAQIPAFLPSKALNLGLDLQGGSQILFEVDLEKLRDQQLNGVGDQMREALRQAEPRIVHTRLPVDSAAARVRLGNPADMERALRVLAPLKRSSTSVDDILAIADAGGGVIEARITPIYLTQLGREAAQQSIEVIRRRIDPNGTSEVSIARQGDQRIVVQAPGVDDPQELKDRIGQTALMTFHMVATARTVGPTMTVGPYPGVGNEEQTIVEEQVRLTGENLRRANPQTDQYGVWGLSFDLDDRGGRTFCRITREFTGERFAILLDNKVLTAPVIREPICGGGGRIDGSFDVKSANDLALMLNAGALPAPLKEIEQRSVGAELGQDSISAGSRATLVASIAVVAFMVLFYGLFGLLACLALVVNMAMIIGSMTLGGATLTLPGIAGLVLTIGMAVDANVLIYERMREEKANGRGPAMAIDAGFHRAMVTILDSHITQFGAAIILFGFGAGPVKGFAWTLSIGCITSVITAVFVTQLLIAFWFRIVRPKDLPI
ncbi:MAG: protein translocase subunit SecD [Terricaulis sp.]